MRALPHPVHPGPRRAITIIFVFFSYRYYHSYWGIRAVPEKSILVPTAERDPVVNLRIFRDLFRLPRAFVYNSVEERDMINRVAGNSGVPGDIVGVGIEVPAVVLGGDGSARRTASTATISSTSGASTKTRAVPSSSGSLPPLQEGDRLAGPARPHREGRSCRSRPTPIFVRARIPPGAGQVRRPGRGTRPPHAVLLREPVHGHARGVGDAEAGPGERPLRGPQGPVPAEPGGALLRDYGEFAGALWTCFSGRRTCAAVWAGTGGPISTPITPGNASRTSIGRVLERLEGN